MLTQKEINELNAIRSQSLDTADRAMRLIKSAGVSTPAPFKKKVSSAVEKRNAKIFKNKKALMPASNNA